MQDEIEESIKKTKNKADKQSLEAALRLLKNDKGAYPQQMLVAQISYIYYMVNGADQLVGNDVVDRYAELKGQLDKVRTSLK